MYQVNYDTTPNTFLIYKGVKNLLVKTMIYIAMLFLICGIEQAGFKHRHKTVNYTTDSN